MNIYVVVINRMFVYGPENTTCVVVANDEQEAEQKAFAYYYTDVADGNFQSSIIDITDILTETVSIKFIARILLEKTKILVDYIRNDC